MIFVPKEKLTRFERTRLISSRSLQLSFGAPPLIKPKKDAVAYYLAKGEFEKNVLPLVILRTYPSGKTIKITDM